MVQAVHIRGCGIIAGTGGVGATAAARLPARHSATFTESSTLLLLLLFLLLLLLLLFLTLMLNSRSLLHRQRFVTIALSKFCKHCMHHSFSLLDYHCVEWRGDNVESQLRIAQGLHAFGCQGYGCYLNPIC